MSKNRVEVVIDGQIITLVSEEKESHMQKLALYIDKKMSEIKSSQSSRPINDSLKTLYIAVNIADDYFKAQKDLNKLEETHEAFVQEMGQMQKENTLLTEKLQDLQARLNYMREQYLAESAQLQEVNDNMALHTKELEEQLKRAQSELDEYINTFDERKKVVNFSR